MFALLDFRLNGKSQNPKHKNEEILITGINPKQKED